MAWIEQELGRLAPMRASFNQYLRLEKKEEYAKRFLAAVAVENYELACREGDAALDNERVLFGDRYFHPWVDDWFPPRPAEYYETQLKKVESWAAHEKPSPWTRYFRALLLGHLGRERESLSEFDRLGKEEDKRYGWMRYAAGVRRLLMGRFEEAVSDFEATTVSRPDIWMARCHLAETYLCLGKTTEAFKEFDAAEAVCDAKGVSDVRAWRGEGLLWIGKYKEAIEECDRAIRSGSSFARCWRGAAYMLEGDMENARRDLDRAAAGGLRDAEIYLWRGEILRRLGEPKAALADLNLSLEYGGGTWAYVNRALIYADAGDWTEVWKNLEKLPAVIFDFNEESGSGGMRGLDEPRIVEQLEAALAAAAGVRRPEPYAASVWLNLCNWEERRGR
jgi:tetratricopeptide (TPR) repeat protein